MRELVRRSPHRHLGLAEYWPEFERRFWATAEPGFWKLERQQTFQEPDEPSWRAFAAGDWEECLRLVEAKREEIRDYFRRVAAAGFINRRVRIVDRPISPYLQWELHVLRIRHEYGGLVRVLEPAQVAEFERHGPLPEIYTLGREVKYEAVYDDQGVLASANRFTDRALIDRCQRFIAELYGRGEPLDAFFAREVAPLGAPAR